MRVVKKFTKGQVELILAKYRIKIIGNFTIRADGKLDVKGHVKITGLKLLKLPVKFNCVTGDFLSKSGSLRSLKGCPRFVGGSFDCSDNQLLSLEGGPDYVGLNYLCNENELTSLKGCPHEIIGRFSCVLNKLESLQFGPRHVGGRFDAHHNQLRTLLFAPLFIQSSFNVSANNLMNLIGCPDYIGDTFHFDHWIPSLYMGKKNCITRFIKIEVLEKTESSQESLPPHILSHQKELPILFRYNFYLEIYNEKGQLDYDNLNNILIEVKDGLL